MDRPVDFVGLVVEPVGKTVAVPVDLEHSVGEFYVFATEMQEELHG